MDIYKYAHHHEKLFNQLSGFVGLTTLDHKIAFANNNFAKFTFKLINLPALLIFFCILFLATKFKVRPFILILISGVLGICFL